MAGIMIKEKNTIIRRKGTWHHCIELKNHSCLYTALPFLSFSFRTFLNFY